MRICVVSFSPTGVTERLAQSVAETLAAELAGKACCGGAAPHIERIPYTLPGERVELHFTPEDVVIAAAPVYAGRLPNKLLPELQAKLAGSGTAALAVCTFGNRSCGEALRELVLLLEQNGFCPLGAAAFAVQHAFTGRVGTARPDAADQSEIDRFARQAAEKLEQGAAPLAVDHSPIGPYYTPLKADGTPAKFLKAKPVLDPARCDGCGRCAQCCPMGSIDPATHQTVGVCIKCQACIQSCPRGARSLADPDFLSHVAMLEQNFAARRADNVVLL